MVMLATSSAHSFANDNDKAIKAKISAMTTEEKNVRAEEIKARVLEIRAMDKYKLNSEERKEIRQELRSMNKEAKAMGNGGIYLSLAAILIIILVLILVL
jgi:spore coat polysaccharide biosynthesis predicted glycosyltransferase SpsG